MKRGIQVFALLTLVLFTTNAWSWGWSTTSNLNSGRREHTATLLQDGRVLLVGGFNGTGVVNSCEVYDFNTNTTSNASAMSVARRGHAAVLLTNGNILVFGGLDASGNPLASAEIYNPSTQSWSSATSMNTPRSNFGYCVLSDGRILVAGGLNGATYLNTSEIYNPASNTWTATTGSMTSSRSHITATLMGNGKVLVTGGKISAITVVNTSEEFDPASGTWSASAGNLGVAQQAHSIVTVLIPNGKVLAYGGGWNASGNGSTGSYFSYDPATRTWTNLGVTVTPRQGHTATLLPNGKVFFTGGFDGTTYHTSGVIIDATATVGNRDSSVVMAMSNSRGLHAAVLLPSGDVYVSGGRSSSVTARNTAELYNYRYGKWTTLTSLPTTRYSHRATPLKNGRVLITGGTNVGCFSNCVRAVLNTAVVYDPSGVGSIVASPTMNHQRLSHTATLLDDGRVLIAGGSDLAFDYYDFRATNTCEIFDPATNTFTPVASMSVPRGGHSAIALPDGRVLIMGGSSYTAVDVHAPGSPYNTCEIYDPTTNTWTPAASLVYSMDQGQVLTPLPNGKIFMALHPNAQVYDPCTDRWIAVASSASLGTIGSGAVSGQLLPNGKVLYIGGAIAPSTGTTRCALYDYKTDSWSNTGSMTQQSRYIVSSSMMRDGRVIVMGGMNGPTNACEIYDPTSGTWQGTDDMSNAKYGMSPILLQDGRIMVSGGGHGTIYNTVEVFDPGYGNPTLAKPTISSITISSTSGNSSTILTQIDGAGGYATIDITGTNFRDNGRLINSANAGNGSSPNNHPLVQIMRVVNNDYLSYLEYDLGGGVDWNSTKTKVRFPYGNPNKYPVGLYALRIIVDGIASDPYYFNVKTACDLTADFTYDTVCVSTPTTFTNRTTGTSQVSCYVWNFGDPASGANNTSYLSDPTHVFSAAGTYTVTFTASTLQGCRSTVSHVITVYPSSTPGSIGGTQTICYLGDPTALTNVAPASGSNGVFAYQWEYTTVKGCGSGWTAISGATGLTYDPPAGLTDTTCYRRKVVSLCGTAYTNTTRVSVPTQVTVSFPVSNFVNCHGGNNGSITSLASGGVGSYSYSWATGETTATISGLSLGVDSVKAYTVNVQDGNGCTASASKTITQPAHALEAATTTLSNVDCFGNSTGSASVNSSHGTSPYTYVWSAGSQTASTATGLAANTYTVTITDFNGCTLTATREITEPLALRVSITNVVDVACFGNATGSATAIGADGTGPYNYSWSANAQSADNATGLLAGTYTVLVTDANNCTITASQQITQPVGGLVLNVNSISNVKCFGDASGSATVNTLAGTSPYLYLWSAASQTTTTATGLAAGTYTVVVTDANNCTLSSTAIVAQPQAALSATTNSDLSVKCYGNSTGMASVTAKDGTSAYTYSWSAGGQTDIVATGLAAGVYTVLVTDANNCTITVTQQITQPNAPLAATINSVSNVLCFGNSTGEATVTATEGTSSYTYVWSPGGQTGATATALNANTYTVTVTDANQCTISLEQTITQPFRALAATISDVKNVSCNGLSDGSITVTAVDGTNPYKYLWSSNSQTGATATGLAENSYTVIVTDDNGCTVSLSQQVTQPGTLTAAVGSVVNPSCYSASTGSATANVNAGTSPYTYLWSAGGQTSETATGLAANSYTVNVTDANNCTALAAVTLTQPPAPELSLNGDQSMCLFYSATIAANVVNGTSPINYAWSNGVNSTANSITVSPGSTTTYSVVVTDACGLVMKDSVKITIWPKPHAQFTSTPASVGVGDDVTFTDESTDALAWDWNFGDETSSAEQNPVHKYSKPGSYTTTLIVTNNFGCKDTAQNVTTEVEEFVVVPNVFTPNGDGVNDSFHIKTSGAKEFLLVVYDRWGLKMYETNNPNADWEGSTLSGSKATTGTYYYTLKVVFESGKPHDSSGFISLVQ